MERRRRGWVRGRGVGRGEVEPTVPHSLIDMKPIWVPKLRPSRTWEKNLSGWQDVQRLRSCFWSSIFCGKIPPRSRRILSIKIFQKIARVYFTNGQCNMKKMYGYWWKRIVGNICLEEYKLLFSYRTWTNQEMVDFITIYHLNSYMKYTTFHIVLQT